MIATQTRTDQTHAPIAARAADAYVGRRGAIDDTPAPSVHGDLKVLRGLAARQNATRRMGQNRRSHGRNQGW